MKELLRALDRGLWALRSLIDLGGIVLISSLFILFGLQFKHPAGWDNMAAIMSFRKVADPLLMQIASGIDLKWPAEQPSFLPLVLSVAVFFARSLLVHWINSASAAIRRRIGKPVKTKKRPTLSPPLVPVPVEAAQAPSPAPAPAPVAPSVPAAPTEPPPAAPPPVAAAAPPVPTPAPSGPVDSDQRTMVVSSRRRPASSASNPNALGTPAPFPVTSMQGSASLSDFLHLGDDKAPTMLGRTPRPQSAQSTGGRRRGPKGREVDTEAPTMDGQRAAKAPSPNDTPIFGRYEILQELGRGGMGVVYKARDPKIDRVVAIKSILSTHSDEESAEEYERRFRREVKAVGKLTHASIVTVYDFIEDHLGRPAMVMEFVEGETLQQYYVREKPTLTRSLEIMIQAAEALDHAHAQGIVHRDMKPPNILIARDGRAKVSDFGIAKVGGGTNTNTKGGLVGTPAFMSPEQFLGRKIDGRTDIFSLGAILYWLCTGERPFTGDTIANLAYQIVHVNPPSVLKYKADLPEALDEIIATSMAKDEDNRYRNALAFAEDLKALRDNRPLPSLAMTSVNANAPLQAEESEVETYEVLEEEP
jgi:tRNA A-37 threonylcarbamoyl transferase component Bud32